MRFKYTFGALIFVAMVSVFWAQEKKQPEPTPPPAATSQPAQAPAAQAPAAQAPAAQAPATQAPAAQAPAAPHTFTITPEDAARKNPLRFSEISVERGKKIYETQCAMCHGEKGDGKGEIVADMKINPPDFTKPETLANRTDGELFTIIQVGDATMPGQGTRMTDTYKWELVNYLRSLSGKTPLKSTEEELQQGTVVVTEKEPSKENPKQKTKPKPREKP
jgi:mono/diheme cytochrome c family protein